jgi:large subunit ribosomal protein L15
MFSTTFVGGQTPLHRRLPKRGFSNATWAKVYAIVNIGDLNAFDDGARVDIAALRAKRIVNGTWDGLRVLANGELTKKLTVVADHFSESAKSKIEAKGGTCEVIPPPNKPVRNKMGKGKNSAKPKAPKS